MEVLEGSRAVAEVVKRCRPHVISAYPITPQTHIVENLAQMVADGELASEFVNVESEHSAASVCLGAAATGARTYTATSSQGLALMSEVLYNIAGLRLPVVLTCANRTLSAPLSIWNDHQDSLMVRDAGVIQLFAEDCQEAADMHIQAYKLAEDHRVLLPVMVAMDGFILTHTFEPVTIPTQEEVDAFLPPYQPLHYLTPKAPLSMGTWCEPDKFLEVKYMMHQAMEVALTLIPQIAEDFRRHFGRYSGGLIEEYRMDDAQTAFVAMGSLVTTIKDTVDELREEGHRVGLVKIRAYRPFPTQAVARALEGVERVAVIEKAISIGGVGILAADIKSALYGRERPMVGTFIAGLGGRDVTKDSLRWIMERLEEGATLQEFVDLNLSLIGDDEG
ncbi:MAG: pyruvate ferredoxin oxidoreductase [Chloroflexi bacterium]|nr:pyruvate ferredoxin oxidoreductase [Chloroflexota bacterium]